MVYNFGWKTLKVHILDIFSINNFLPVKGKESNILTPDIKRISIISMLTHVNF
jgi:hypothetical protein